MENQTAAKFVMYTLRKAGFEAVLAGGCVRDLVLNRTPKDYDVATNARPEQVLPLFEKTIPVGAKFGVVVVMVETLLPEDSVVTHQIEVATFRADGAYSDGRHPDEVRYSDSVKEDVERRDFSMNGLVSTHLSIEEAGDHSYDGAELKVVNDLTVIDFVGGLEDIKNKTIRAIGDPNKRFEEDALRMLRAVRFVAQLGFEIEENTFKAIQHNADKIKLVSRERIASELFKLTTGKFAVNGVTALMTTGLFRHIFPDTFVMGAQTPYTLERFATFQTTNPVMGLAMLLAACPDVAAVEMTLDSLKLSNDISSEIQGALANQWSLFEAGKCEWTRAALIHLARRQGVLSLGVDLFEQSLALGIWGIWGDSVGEREMISCLRSLTPEQINPTPLVTGEDLIAMGYKPSRLFSVVLAAVEVAQLNGRLTSREDALQYTRTCVLNSSKDENVWGLHRLGQGGSKC